MIENASLPREDLLNPDQFRCFYTEALPRVYGYHYQRCGGNAALAEDLTQETFLAAVRELRRDRAVTTPLPWIIGIARHKLLDHFRQQRRMGWSLLSLDDDEATMTINTDELDEGRALTVLASVPSPQRDALVLRYLDGHSIPEIAELLERSVEAVESLLTRGKATFWRAYLEAADGD